MNKLAPLAEQMRSEVFYNSNYIHNKNLLLRIVITWFHLKTCTIWTTEQPQTKSHYTSMPLCCTNFITVTQPAMTGFHSFSTNNLTLDKNTHTSWIHPDSKFATTFYKTDSMCWTAKLCSNGLTNHTMPLKLSARNYS